MLKFTTISIYEDDADFIRSLSKKGRISVVQTMSKLVDVIRGNEENFLSGTLALSFEKVLDKYAEKIRKGMVKENNRILGIYMNTNKMVRSMNRDMHYLLNWEQEDRIRLHPFFAEYEIQIEMIMLYLDLKYDISGTEALAADMKECLTKAQIEDYLLAVKRTKSRTISTPKY